MSFTFKTVVAPPVLSPSDLNVRRALSKLSVHACKRALGSCNDFPLEFGAKGEVINSELLVINSFSIEPLGCARSTAVIMTDPAPEEGANTGTDFS